MFFKYILFGKYPWVFMFFKIENGTLLKRSLPIFMVHYMEYQPGPHGLSKSYWHRGLHSHLFHAPPASLHQCLLQLLKHTVGKDRSFQHKSILTSFVMIPTPFSAGFTFFSMQMVIKIIPKNVSWPRRDLNTQPSDLESDALPLRHGVSLW